MHTWLPGDEVVLRGIAHRRPWFVQSLRVVYDTAKEIALLLIPGAECAAPSGYIHQKHGDHSHWNRWQETINNSWKLEKYKWHTNRFLILLEPQKYYACNYIWDHESDKFKGYYINFQLPFDRSPRGFDTYDLELDIVVDPAFHWKWKDKDEYQEGIKLGVIKEEWVNSIDCAQIEVLERLEKRFYPFNTHWCGWFPDKSWTPPTLPANWDQ